MLFEILDLLVATGVVNGLDSGGVVGCDLGCCCGCDCSALGLFERDGVLQYAAGWVGVELAGAWAVRNSMPSGSWSAILDLRASSPLGPGFVSRISSRIMKGISLS